MDLAFHLGNHPSNQVGAGEDSCFVGAAVRGWLEASEPWCPQLRQLGSPQGSEGHSRKAYAAPGLGLLGSRSGCSPALGFLFLPEHLKLLWDTSGF